MKYVKHSVIVVLLLAVLSSFAIPPAAAAGNTPAASSNINDHFYTNAQRFAAPIKSALIAENGGYTRVEYTGDRIVVEYYDAALNYLSGMDLADELPIFGGIYVCDDYNFVVTGQTNPSEDNDREVFRITRYNKDWTRIDHTSLFGANTTVPFRGGCCRFDRSGDILYIRTCHEMYASSDGLNHQANVFLSVRISDMTVTDYFTGILNQGYGYISHSFNQFVRVDGNTLLAVDHGDAHPRSIVLIKYGKRAGAETFFGRVSCIDAFPIVDSTGHYNDTGVSLGGFECSSTDYLIAGCGYDQTESIDLFYAYRNIFVTATPKDDFSEEATTITWLTHYAQSEQVRVSPPHFIKLNDNCFMLTWTENDALKYCFVNGRGQLIGKIMDGDGDLSDCVPIVDGNRILWYVTNWSAPVFYELSTVIPHTHTYTAAVTDPTCTVGGCTTHTCSVCGESYTDTPTAALGHDWDDWYTVTEPTCADAGSKQQDCKRCDAQQSGQIPALGHDWDDWYTVTEPACAVAGSKQQDCKRCDAHQSGQIPALGHIWDGLYCERCSESREASGDVNGDGKVNGTDTNLVFRFVSGTALFTDDQRKAADVNGDGKVNGTDTNLVFRFVSGTIKSFD